MDAGCIYPCTLAAGHFRRTFEPVGRGAGFSRFLLLAVGKGESLPADGPCPNRSQVPVLFEVLIQQMLKTGST
jgi:hypothetical protein